MADDAKYMKFEVDDILQIVNFEIKVRGSLYP